MAESQPPVFDEEAGGDEVAVDEKGRVVVSKGLRERVGEPFVLGRGEVGCLILYPRDEWNALNAMVKKVDPWNPARRTFERLMVGGAQVGETFDKQGRVLVPKDMREFAKLKDRARVIGISGRVEVWASQEFAAYQNDPEGYNRERRESVERAYWRLVGQA